MKNQSHKVKRNINVTENDLFNVFNNLKKMEAAFLNEVKLFLPNKEQDGYDYRLSLISFAIINRSISLMRGFLTLAKENNYISANTLIRIQLDNCIRFYAVTLVNDLDDFFSKFIEGTHIRNLKDMSGEKMTDNYLIKKLDKLYPGIHNLYINSSGYVHFSNEHSYLQTKSVEIEERVINTRIGYFDFFVIDKKVDFAFNMYKASEILLNLIHSVREIAFKNNNITDCKLAY